MLGDLGDCVAALPILRALGGGTIVISEDPTGRWPGPRETMRGPRYDAILPLLLAQDYVEQIEWQDHPTGITHDLSRFRDDRKGAHENLALWQARVLGVDVDLTPWLTLPETRLPHVGNYHGKVVFARTKRYHNYFFPWADLLRKHEEKGVFVGLKTEHEALEEETHRPIPYHHTPNLLDLAAFLAGAKLVIANQSVCFWIAIGLGVPLIQESWPPSLNSIIPRTNAVYTPTDVETRTLMLRLYPKKPLDRAVSNA